MKILDNKARVICLLQQELAKSRHADAGNSPLKTTDTSFQKPPRSYPMHLSHWLALMYVLYKTAVSHMYNAFLSSPEFSRRLLETLTLEAANLKQEWPWTPDCGYLK